jgi:hypothetical protein
MHFCQQLAVYADVIATLTCNNVGLIVIIHACLVYTDVFTCMH